MKKTLPSGELLSLPWKANRCCAIRGGGIRWGEYRGEEGAGINECEK